MIVLDAGVVIAHFAASDPHAASASQIMDTDDDLGIHPVSLAESLVRAAVLGEELATLARVERIGIEQVAPSGDQPLVLARLRAHTRLKMPDCCVLAAALQTGATVATFDRRVADAARELGLDAVGA